MDKEKLLQAVKTLRAAHDKLGGLIDTIEALSMEEATPGQIAKGLVGDFIVVWGKRYKGQTYVVTNWPRELGAVKRLLKGMSADELRARLVRYVASDDPFYAGARHPLPMFWAAVNKFGAEVGQRRLLGDSEDEGGEDWFAQCKRLHGLKCNGRHGHATQLALDEARRGKTAVDAPKHSGQQ